MTDHGLGWCVSFADYRGWRERDVREPVPKMRVCYFDRREDAERECRLQKLAGMTACVSPALPPRRRGNGAKSRLPMPLPIERRPG